jgi:hypothetical protein
MPRLSMEGGLKMSRLSAVNGLCKYLSSAADYLGMQMDISGFLPACKLWLVALLNKKMKVS